MHRGLLVPDAGLTGIQTADDEGSRLAALARSPRLLAALALVYAASPAILREGGDDAFRLRILAASGALLGGAPALALARRLPRHVRPAFVLVGGIAGALLFVAAVAVGLGGSVSASDVFGLPVLFPALAFAAAVTLMLASVDAMGHEHALAPIVAALALAAFGIAPMANALAPVQAGQWFAGMSGYWMLGGSSVVLLALALSRWLPESVDRVWGAMAGAVMRPRRPVVALGAALFAFAVTAAVAVVCFARQPHNADEVAQLWHARILLSGHLSLPADPNPEFFGMDNVIDRGRWYSQFPIGGPAFLAIGLMLRAAWLVNPLFLALTIVNVYSFARRAYGEPTARAAALLFAVAPFPLFASASFMNHVPTLWLVSVALTQLPTWCEAETRARAWRSASLIGVALGTAVTVRPLDGAVVGVVIGVFQLAALRGSADRRRSLLVQALAAAVPLAFLLWANALTTGSPLRFGYEVLYGSAHRLGFHIDPYGEAHTPIRALVFASKYLLELDVTLLESPVPAVAIIVAGLLYLRRPTRWDLLLLALVGAQLVAYALYWHEGEFRGPRFLFTALPSLVLLTVRAPFVIAAASRGAVVRRAAPLVLPIALLASWLAYDVDASPIGRLRMYLGTPAVARVDPAAVSRAAGLHHALVFVSESWESQMLRRMWALGIGRGSAMPLLARSHPCAIRQALESEEHLPAATSGRLERILRTTSRYDTTAAPSAECLADLVSDREGVATYAPFFPANTIGPDGKVGGDVVYVLDLGAHDEVLRARFGDRRWYRFGPHLMRGDANPSLEPYRRTVSLR